MSSLHLSPLPDRAILSVSGPDSRDFLQGLISNDINSVSDETSIYAALLTPQGKYLFDFFIAQDGDRLLIDCEKSRLPDLFKRLRMYKLRADATLTDESDAYTILALWGDNAPQAAGLADQEGAAAKIAGGVKFVDPRLLGAGVRFLISNAHLAELENELDAEPGDAASYDLHRLKLGLPDASRDLIPEKSILLESGFDELNGINWDKGCYMGQELTARTKYRGLVKKRLTSISIEGQPPDPGTPIMNGEKVAGEMRSSQGSIGLALIRLEHMQESDTDLTAGTAKIRAQKPDWAHF